MIMHSRNPAHRLCRILLVAASTLLVGACGGSDETTSTSASERGGDRSVLERLWSELEQGEAGGASTGTRSISSSGDAILGFPRDLLPHPDARAESFQLQAMLSDSDGTMLGLQVQLDRVELGITPVADSGWGFSGLMRASVMVEESGVKQPRHYELVQRQALGLAQSTPGFIQVESARLQRQPDLDVGAQDSEACSGGFQLTAFLPQQSRQFFNERDRVEQDRMRSEPDGELLLERLYMDIKLNGCPELMSLRQAHQWQVSDLDVTARSLRTTATDSLLVTEEQYDAEWQNGPGGQNVPGGQDDRGGQMDMGRRWTGHAWLSHAWGALPPPGTGAVVIDQARLYLDAPDTAPDTAPAPLILSASRSKRRSGAGPRTVQASLQQADGTLRTLDMIWIDQGERRSDETGLVYPQRFELESADQSFRLELTPLSELPEISDSLGTRWSGAVHVSGTHTGQGFVEFQAIEQSPTDSGGSL